MAEADDADDVDDVVARIRTAAPGHAAAIVLGLPWVRSRAVLSALGPREVARLLVGARADRVPDLVESVPPGLLAEVLAQLAVGQVAALVPLLPMDAAARVLQNMSPRAAAELLLALPTHQRLTLQEALPQSSAGGAGDGDYARRVEGAVRRIAGRASWLDQRGGTLLTEVFGRPIQVTAHDAPEAMLTAHQVQSFVTATDWRRVSGLLVMTSASLDPGLGSAVREARARGYRIEVVQWQDDRDDGVLKRVIVRLAS